MTTRPPDLRPDLKQRVLAAAHDEASRALAKERGLPSRPIHFDLGAEAPLQTALGQRDREPALGDVVGARQLPRANRRANCRLEIPPLLG